LQQTDLVGIYIAGLADAIAIDRLHIAYSRRQPGALQPIPKSNGGAIVIGSLGDEISILGS
jgi:hypothetical protein